MRKRNGVSAALTPVQRHVRLHCRYAIATALSFAASSACWANCTGTTNVSCNTAAPNPYPSRVGNGPNTPAGASVTLADGAQIAAGNVNAVSLGDGATITLGTNASITNNATSSSGLWSAGPNTIEFGSNGRLTVGVGASIQANGTQNNGESVNVMGVGNVITNYGLLSSKNGAAIWFEDRVTGGVNTIDNYGTIRTQLGANANVIGNSRDGNVTFINRTGGRIEGSLSFAAGNDQLTLEAGSVITGSFDGGGGTNSLTLGGALGSADSLAGNIRNFQSLIKDGAGTWTLTGAVGANGGGVPLQVLVHEGTLALTGNNSSFNGGIVVDAAGVLEARAQSLPPSVTDNGLVRFVQDGAGTFSGVIQGIGRLEKTLGGELTLSGTNTYSGGTTVLSGAVRITADANLGATSGALTLDGGALRTATDVTTARSTTLGATGGTFDTLAGTLTHNGVISGTGNLVKQGAGTLLLTGANTYTGSTLLNAGALQVSTDSSLGAAGSSLLFNGGTLRTTADMTTSRATVLGTSGGTFETLAGTTLTHGGNVSGAGQLIKEGAGTLILSSDNAYSGGTAINDGIVQIASDAKLGAASAVLSFDGGTLRAANGMTLARGGLLNAGGGTIEVGGDPSLSSDFVFFDGVIGGAGGLNKTGSGTLILNGANNYTGPTNVSSGYLYVDGDQSAATGPTTVSGASSRLSGSGILGGDVTIENGATLGPGFVPLTAATLTINGNLNLGSDAILLYNMVEANVAGGALNDLTVVHGNLTLDGTINILDQGQTFGPGVYRIINYDGTLTDNGLAVGSLMQDPVTPLRPLTEFTVQTAVAGQVNLIDATGLALNYWDGTAGPKNNNLIDGGDGTWRHAGPTATANFTDPLGSVNAPWADGQFAIFTSTPGTVTTSSENGQITISGMQFASDGYRIQGDPLEMVGSTRTPGGSIIRVGDGTAASTGMTATVDALLTGVSMLTKTDLGTLVLTGANTYSGGTEIDGGVVQIASDANLGALPGGLVLDGGALRTTADIVTSRATTLNAGGGTFETAAGTTLNLATGATGVGALTKTGVGTLLLSGANTYTGGTTISAGELRVGDGGTAGSLVGNVVDNASLVFNRADPYTFGGIVSGTGTLLQNGAGTLILTGDSTYSGGTTIATGSTLQLGSGGTTGSVAGNIVDNGALVFAHDSGTTDPAAHQVTVAGTISGSGSVLQNGNSTIILTGNNSYTGTTSVASGYLYVNGDQSLATGLTSVAGGARLGGDGIIGGDVTIAGGGTLTPGVVPGTPATLTINGSLTLNDTSTLYYDIEEANTPASPRNDLTNVHGNLVLDGVIDVLDRGQSLVPGVYRLINYDGTLTNNGLAVGALRPDLSTPGTPLTGFFVQTAIAGQVNLINSSGLALNYWDGGDQNIAQKDNSIIDGGDGTWYAAGLASTSNWTDANGSVNAPWGIGQYAIFSGTPGTVTVSLENGPVQITGVQFATSGYRIEGDALSLIGPVLIRVGDGTTAGAGITATIDAVLSGSTNITKIDAGTLILGGANTYRGGTRVIGGVLQISSDANLGGPEGALTLDVGALRTTADITSARAVTLTTSGTFETLGGTSLTLGGIVSGNGVLNKTGAGTLMLTADNNYSGGTSIGAGTLQLGNGGTGGSIIGDVVDNGTLAFNRADTMTFAGTVSGAGALLQSGSGTTILTAENTYTGGTTISAGTLQVGNGGTTGRVLGDILDNGTFVVNRSDAKILPGRVSGTGQLIQAGSGTTILTAENTYTGGTTISAGTLQIGNGDITGSIVGNVLDNGALVFNRSDTLTFAGTISGLGTLEQAGPGTTILTGNSTYTGGTTVSAGTLQIGDGGTSGGILGDVLDNGTVIINRSDDLVYGGVVSGVGAAIKRGAGKFTVTGQNTYTGGTTISEGTLQIGDGGTAGSLLGDIVDNAALVFNHSDDLLVGGVISGTGTLEQAGSGTTVLGANNSYGGGTTISAGTLQVGNGSVEGSIVGNVLDDSILAFNRSDTLTFEGVVSGTGQLVQAGTGTLLLTANNTYGGGTAIEAGALQIASDANLGAASGGLRIAGGTLATTADITMARDTVLAQLGGTFDTLAGTSLTNAGLVDGAGGLTKAGDGLFTLSGSNSYAGPTSVLAGTLRVDGDQSAATGMTSVASGARVGGTGIIGGDVLIADGGILAPGDSPGTLTINGGLTLNAGSLLDYEFGAAGIIGGQLNDHTIVHGDLVLDGTIDVSLSPGGSLEPGLYRVLTYDGALANNGLALGAVPIPELFVQTSIATQVNLVNTAGLTLNLWDGAAGPKIDGVINGGDGVWQNQAGNDAWTNDTGALNAPFADRTFAIFTATPGTVTVDTSLGPVDVAGMQFASDGYRLAGDPLNLVGTAADPGASVIRVGDGTAESAAMTATIDAVLAGDSSLVKTDPGTLVLGGVNTYTGGTLVKGGTLQISSDANLGASTGALSLDGGTLRTTTDFTLTRTTTLLQGGGGFEPVAGTQLELATDLTGAGALVKLGEGTAILTGANSYAGGTFIEAGTLQVGNGGTVGTLTGDVTNNSVLAFNRTDVMFFDGSISGTGSLIQLGTGTTVLTADNSYTGTTVVDAGTLAIGDSGHPTAALSGGGNMSVSAGATFGGYGSVAGSVDNSGTVAVADALGAFAQEGTGTFTIGGTLRNAGIVRLSGPGVGNRLVVGNYEGAGGRIGMNVVLEGDNSASDTLVINGGAATGHSLLDVTNIGGRGEATPGNGILLVDAVNGATSTGDAFVLGKRVVAGPYEYTLFRGSRDSLSPESWFLRSELVDPPVPVEPPSPQEPPPVTPNYRPEVSLYSALPSMALSQGMALIGTLHERVGEEMPFSSEADAGGEPAESWGRVIGKDGRWNARRGGIYRDGPSFDHDMLAAQAGLSLYHDEHTDGGRTLAGLLGSLGRGHGRVDNYDGTAAGNVGFDTQSFGAYGTHYGKSGWYLDAVAQATWYQMTATPSVAGSSSLAGKLRTHGSITAASLEGGYPYRLRNGWSLEPQIQVIYQDGDLDDAADPAADVRFNDVDALTARVGARAARTWSVRGRSGDSEVTGWVVLNWWRELESNARTEISSASGFVPFHSDLRASWAQIGAGVSVDVTDRWSAYGSVGYQKGFDHGMRSVDGNVGVRVKW